MESNISLSSGNLLPADPGYGGFDLQGLTRVNPNQPPHHCLPPQGLMPQLSMNGAFPLAMGQNHACGNKTERPPNFSPRDEEENNCIEDGMDKGKKVPWQRVKWADSMVRLLITAVSYMDEDAVVEGGLCSRRKPSTLHKKGKWKLASKVMGERGFCVSPQQCEDKFNDLNKRYKKLNDILGRGTSCQVVENPTLLDTMGHLSDKKKDEVRKILSSKQLFYEEMCSYHNNNRLHLPHDPGLQRSLQLALGSGHDYDTDFKRCSHDDAYDGEDDHDHDHDNETDDHDYEEDNRSSGAYMGLVNSSKRMKTGEGSEEFAFGDPRSFTDLGKGLDLQSQNEMHMALQEGGKASSLQKQWLKSRLLQLEEKRLQIESEMLELEKQRFKWQRFSKKKDQELEELKMENDRMKHENERKALELKRMEMSINCNK